MPNSLTLTVVKSTTTGKYHMAAGGAQLCNYSGQVRSSRSRLASEEEIARASESSFCKKCFPNGKPSLV